MHKLFVFSFVLLSVAGFVFAQETITKNPAHDFEVLPGKTLDVLLEDGANFRIRLYEGSTFTFTLHDVTCILLIDRISVDEIEGRLKVGNLKYDTVVFPINKNKKVDVYGKKYFDMVMQPFMVHKSEVSSERSVVFRMWVLQNVYVNPEQAKELFESGQGQGIVGEETTDSFTKYYILGFLVLLGIVLVLVYKKGGKTFAQERKKSSSK